MLGLKKDEIQLCEHDKEWPIEFEKEKKILTKILGKLAVSIEHVGSTAIPNLKAKPVIDIAVGIKDLSVLPEIMKRLSDEGYKVKGQWNEVLEETFVSKGVPECRTHNIHVEIYGGKNWNNQILFKKYLLNHPKAVKEYEEMKLEMCAKFNGEENGRKQYQASKERVVSKMMEKAIKEFGWIKPLN